MDEQHEPEGSPYDPRVWAGSPYAPSAGYPYYGQAYPDQQHVAPVYGSPVYGSPQPPPAPVPPPARRRRLALVLGAAAVAAAAVIGIGVATGNSAVNGSPVASRQTPSTAPTVPTVPAVPNDPFGNGGTTTPGTGRGSDSTTSAGQATATQSTGVVDIYTQLKFQGASAAGTGMVIDSNGYVLTNNHVIDGATTIRVVVVSTGKTYRATVVGTAPTEDIAVLKLSNASGLATAKFGDSDTVKVGDAVTGVGNAGGTGGTPSAAKGTVVSLNNSITASDESGANAERLTGVIATNAAIQSGDSGGPLYNAKDEVIGIDTAASTSGRAAGFAIPINKALSVAAQIRKGVETSVIHIGYPPFLGVSVSPQSTNGQGALISGVVQGLPAARAGIEAGDVIIKVDGTAIANYSQLTKKLRTHNPGDTVRLTYRDPQGVTHTASVTLVTGPAD